MIGKIDASNPPKADSLALHCGTTVRAFSLRTPGMTNENSSGSSLSPKSSLDFRGLHKLPSSERCNLIRVEFKPLAVLPFLANRLCQ